MNFQGEKSNNSQEANENSYSFLRKQGMSSLSREEMEEQYKILLSKL